jgi:hypothetical protein
MATNKGSLTFKAMTVSIYLEQSAVTIGTKIIQRNSISKIGETIN